MKWWQRLTGRTEREPKPWEQISPTLTKIYNRLTLKSEMEFGGFGSYQGEVTRKLSEANAVTSKWFGRNRHTVILDVDYPVEVVPSTTEGHYHLYLNIPQGLSHPRYMGLLSILGEYGIIEPGYAAASIERGFTCLRLPWVRKSDEERERVTTY